MGAYDFFIYSTGKTATKAFNNIKGEVTKQNFIQLNVTVRNETEAMEVATDLLHVKQDKRVNDKYGPAGCLWICESRQYLFFGWEPEDREDLLEDDYMLLDFI